MTTKLSQLLTLARRKGALRSRDLKPHDIPRPYLQRLVRQGLLERTGRGLYRATGAEVTEHHSLALATKRVPHGVVCLLSALRFHGLTTQAPFEVWMALPEGMGKPSVDHPPLRIVHMSDKTLVGGAGEHEVEGILVKVTDPAKTVVDCFKFRNRVGLDVALEALRDFSRKHPEANDELWRLAKACRMANVMRPYLEAMA